MLRSPPHMNRNVLVSLSLAIILISVSTVSAVIVESPATEQNNSTASEMTIEEFNNLRNEYAKEVESSIGISYEEYCSEIEALDNKIIYFFLDEYGSISVSLINTIDSGRNGVDCVSHGIDIYIDSCVCAGLAGVSTGLVISALIGSGVGICVATFVAGYLVQWFNENNGWCNGIVIEVYCRTEIKIFGHSIWITLPQNMWKYNIKGQ